MSKSDKSDTMKDNKSADIVRNKDTKDGNSEYEGAFVFPPSKQLNGDLEYIEKLMCDENMANCYPEDVKWLLKHSFPTPVSQGCSHFMSEYYTIDRMCYSCFYPYSLSLREYDLHDLVVKNK
jgi:hypothetical protein